VSRVLVIEKTDHFQPLPRPRFAGDLSPSTPCPFLKPRWKSFTAGATTFSFGMPSLRKQNRPRVWNELWDRAYRSAGAGGDRERRLAM